MTMDMPDSILKKSIMVLLLAVMYCAFFIGWIPRVMAAASQPLPPPETLRYAPLPFNLPKAERVVLENGIIIYIMENHELPVVNINALVKTGTVHDPEGKAGVAELTAYVMRTGGTKKLNSADVDKQLDFMAASASIGMSLESSQVSFSVLNENLERGLDVLAQILIEPAFEQEKFELARQLKYEELRRLKDDPQKLALREFNRLIYARDPRGHLPSGKSLSRIERNDLVAFHKNYFIPNNMMFAVSGDMTKEDVLSLFGKYFGIWKAGPMPSKIPSPSRTPDTGLFVINKEIAQSTIIKGMYTTGKNHPDFYAFTVLDFIVGSGGFSSRIFSFVRNNEGLAYSAGSFYRNKPDYGIFGAYAFTKTASTMKTLTLINSILENVHAGSVTTKEIEWAKKSINNGFVFSFDTPEQVVWQQMNLEYEKLPEDFLLNYRQKIDDVTVMDVNNAAAKYLDHANNVVLILGDSNNFDPSPTLTHPPVFIVPEE